MGIEIKFHLLASVIEELGLAKTGDEEETIKQIKYSSMCLII